MRIQHVKQQNKALGYRKEQPTKNQCVYALLLIAHGKVLVVTDHRLARTLPLRYRPFVIVHWRQSVIRTSGGRCRARWLRGTGKPAADDMSPESGVKHLLHLVRVLVHPRAFLVVRPRVVEHKSPVLPEVEHGLVVIRGDAFTDRGHGDGLPNDLVVIGI